MNPVLVRTSLAGLMAMTIGPVTVVASQRPVPDVTVQVMGVDTIAGVLPAAKEILKRTYGSIGVRLVVVGAADPVDVRGCWRRIVIEPTAGREFPVAYGRQGVLGISPRTGSEPGRVGYVFLDAITATAKRQDLPVGTVLGYAMAHELGHLLLPSAAHGPAGVMRAEWDGADFNRMRRTALPIGNPERDIIGEYLDSWTRAR